jgi:dolichol kinase
MALAREEILRKVLHVFSGALIPAAIFYIPHYLEQTGRLSDGVAAWVYPVIILSIVLAVFLVIEALRLHSPHAGRLFNRFFGSMLRKTEASTATGATYICASALLCSILFRHQPQVAFIALSTFIWGDGIAAIVGQAFGRIKIGKKSLEGSLACFGLSVLVLTLLFPALPGLLDSWGGRISMPLVLLTAACITIFELIPMRITPKFVINDNLAVPVITGFVMVWFHQIL